MWWEVGPGAALPSLRAAELTAAPVAEARPMERAVGADPADGRRTSGTNAAVRTEEAEGVGANASAPQARRAREAAAFMVGERGGGVGDFVLDRRKKHLLHATEYRACRRSPSACRSQKGGDEAAGVEKQIAAPATVL